MTLTATYIGEQSGEMLHRPLETSPMQEFSMFPALGRPFGSYTLYEASQTPDINVVRDKVDNLQRRFACLADFDFVEGVNLRGENADDILRAREFRAAYAPYHGTERKWLLTEEALGATINFQHYQHHLGRLLDGGEQALPTGTFGVGDRVYFNARIDERDFLFILRRDQSRGQFTGLRMESGASNDEWFQLGADLETLIKQGTVIRDDDGFHANNGIWTKSN